MSNRGFMYTNPLTKPKLLAESNGFIPLFWLSLLSSIEVTNAKEHGNYAFDRKRAIERSAESLSFFLTLFPKVPLFEEAANSFLDFLKSQKSKTIGVDVVQLLADEDDEFSQPLPKLDAAVQAIESRRRDYSLTVPARTIQNPFTREKARLPKTTFRSTRDLLLFVCSIDADTLESKDGDVVRDILVGHVWDRSGGSKSAHDRAKKPSALASELESIAKIVREKGWYPALITDTNPPCLHTIGLAQTMNHPELIIFGISANDAYAAIHLLIEQIRAGESFAEPGVRTVDLAGIEYRLGFRPVDAVFAQFYVPWAIQYFYYIDRIEPPDVMQVFWPDNQGKLPFEEGCDPETCKKQPRLDSVLPQRNASTG